MNNNTIHNKNNKKHINTRWLKAIQKHIRDQGLSYTDLSRDIEAETGIRIERSWLYRIISGQIKPGKKRRLAIAKYFRVSERILWNTDNNQQENGENEVDNK